MTHHRYFTLLFITCASLLIACSSDVQGSFRVSVVQGTILADACFAAPRWWDETVAWVRSIGWDRGRLVQLWLLFMLLGLYVMLRIKPRG